MRKRTFFLALAGCLALLCAESMAGRKHRAHADGRRPHGYMQRLQNALADRYHLPRFQDRDELSAYIKDGKLAKLADTDAYLLDSTFGEKDPDHRALYAHVQPWTKAFLDTEVGSWHAKLDKRFVVTSGVRTQKYQNLLCHGNANAICGGTGWRRSAHLTGATIDIGRVGLSEQEQDYIEGRLNALTRQGKLVYIAESGQQYCFHIMVLPSYGEDAEAATVKRHKTRQKERHPKPPHRAKRHAGHGHRHRARR